MYSAYYYKFPHECYGDSPFFLLHFFSLIINQTNRHIHTHTPKLKKVKRPGYSSKASVCHNDSTLINSK